MYDFLVRGSVDSAESRTAVTAHQGNCEEVLRRHQADAARALRDGMRGVRALAPHLLTRIADARMLRLAWGFLAAKGGQAPGPNGRRYRDYTSSEVWGLCRCLASAVRDGTYRPGSEKVVWIDKGSGRGRRPLVLSNIEDRAVQRAAVSILQPVLDPLFDPHSLGYRPGLGRLNAVALAEWLTVTQDRPVWLCDDLKDAFSHVPVSRLLQVFKKLLPADDLMEFLKRVLLGQELRGLRQGGPLSPLALNVYLHHVLDRPWRRDNPTLPMLRAADDLLVICRTEQEAHTAHAELRRLLVPAAMPLKGSPDTAVHDLEAGGSVDWLGFTVCSGAPGRLAVGVAKHSWARLDQHLELAHTMDHAPLRAAVIVQQWLDQLAPCYTSSDRDRVCRRVVRIARKHAFEEIPAARVLRQRWGAAYARWCRLRESVRVGQYRLSGLTVEESGNSQREVPHDA